MKTSSLEDQVRLSRLAAQVARVGYWRLDAATLRINWSEEMFAIFGLPPGDEPALEAAMAQVHPEDRATSDAQLEAALATGAPYESRTRLVLASGETRTLQGRATGELGADGKVVGVVGALIDITDQVRREAELAASEAGYRLLADHASDIILTITAEDIITYVSPACRRFGYEPEELVGRCGYEITHPDDLPKLRGLIAGLFSGAPVDRTLNRDYRLMAKDGSWVWMEGNPSILRD